VNRGLPNNKLQQTKLAQSDGASLLNLVFDGRSSIAEGATP